MTLQEQANKILEKAEQKGVSTNFFFTTTFKRYQVQMRIFERNGQHAYKHYQGVER